MKGLQETRHYRRRQSVNDLRRSVEWSSPAAAKEYLAERLDSILVLELLQQPATGEMSLPDRQYLQLSVRGLYRHVLAAITGDAHDANTVKKQQHPLQPSLSSPSQQQSSSHSPPTKPKSTVNHPSLQQALTSSTPLGFSAAMAESDGNNRNTEAEEETGNTNQASFGDELPPPLPTLKHRRRAASVTVFPPEMTTQQQETAPAVTYRERLGGYLHPRDMRRLVTPFSASNEPELIVRRHVMLLNFDPLRAIVLRDRLLVLVPDGADSILVQLENRVRSGGGSGADYSADHVASFFTGDGDENVNNSASSYFPDTSSIGGSSHRGKIKNPMRMVRKFFPKKSSDSLKDSSTGKATPGATTSVSASAPVPDAATLENDTSKKEDASSSSVPTTTVDDDDDMEDEWNELKRHEWVDLPFELQCLDAVLKVVASLLTEDTVELQQASQDYIQGMLADKGMTDDPLVIIRALKDAVSEMTSRVKGFVQSLNRVLDEDEDMALMNLSRLLTCPERFIQPVSAEVLEEESDEPELILEAHLQTALSLVNTLNLIQGQIDSCAELIDQKQDAVRNRLLYANMVISIMSLCVAMASLVGAIFGMNLKIDIDDDSNAFTQVTFGTLAGAIGMAVLIMMLLTYSGTIPRTGFSGGI